MFELKWASDIIRSNFIILKLGNQGPDWGIVELFRSQSNSLIKKGQREWGEGELEEGGQNVQTSRYKISKSQGHNVQHGDDS